MGWDVEGGMEETHPQEALDHGRGGPGQSGLSPEQGAAGHPQAQKLRAPGAAAHPAPRAVPCPPWHARTHGGFGDLGISQLAQQGDTTPSKCQGQQPAWLGMAVPLCPHRDTPLTAQSLHSPCHPFPPADLGEPLTSLGWEPGSKLQAGPIPAPQNGPEAPALPVQCSWPKVPILRPPQDHKSLVF